MATPELLLVFPVFDEEDNIGPLLELATLYRELRATPAPRAEAALRVRPRS